MQDILINVNGFSTNTMTPKPILPSTSTGDDPHAAIRAGFYTHCSAARTETKIQLFDLIRNAYPHHHITSISAKQANLIEFAKAGKASFAYDHADGAFTASRVWHAVGDGVEKKLHPGALADKHRFVRFTYLWEGKEFLVYRVTWNDPFVNAEDQFYILYPLNEDKSIIIDGHCLETDALLLCAGKWSSELHNEIYVFDDGEWVKSKELWTAIQGASWDDVILDPAMKSAFIDDVTGFFDNREIYATYGVPWKRGIILHGLPGNGKTISIKAAINTLYARPDHVSALYVKSFKTNCYTLQHSIRSIFEKARESAPCLLVFEDLDSLVTDEVRSYFLNEVDGLESNDGILMIGSTNHLEKLDPAISKRPSRFDRKYQYRLPGPSERVSYAQYWQKKLLAGKAVEFPEELCDIIAQMTDGFSFAYLKELFVMAALSLFRGDSDPEDGEEKKVNGVDGKATEDGVNPGTNSTEQTPTEEKLEETCQCKKTCKDCHLPLEPPAAAEANKTPEAKKKHELAVVEVPGHLADNLLLKALQRQIQTLHAEMDNSVE